MLKSSLVLWYLGDLQRWDHDQLLTDVHPCAEHVCGSGSLDHLNRFAVSQAGSNFSFCECRRFRPLYGTTSSAPCHLMVCYDAMARLDIDARKNCSRLLWVSILVLSG